MIRGAASAPSDLAMKARSKGVEGAAYHALGPWSGGGFHRKIHGTPDPADSELLGQPRDGVEHGRKQVGVLVRVDVRRFDACIQNFLDLRTQFVINLNPAHADRPEKLAYRGRKRLG